MNSNLEHILFEHSYQTESSNEHFSITDEDNSSIVSILLWIVGLGLAVCGVAFHIALLILGLMIAAWAVYLENSRPAKTLTILRDEKVVLIHYNVFGTKKIPWNHISEFVVTDREATNLTNPFEAGNRKHEYELYVRLKSGKELKAIKLDFPSEHDRPMQELTFYLNKIIGKA